MTIRFNNVKNYITIYFLGESREHTNDSNGDGARTQHVTESPHLLHHQSRETVSRCPSYQVSIFFLISFTLYPAHSRVGRGNLVLRHSVPHFLPNSGDIAS